MRDSHLILGLGALALYLLTRGKGKAEDIAPAHDEEPAGDGSDVAPSSVPVAPPETKEERAKAAARVLLERTDIQPSEKKYALALREYMLSEGGDREFVRALQTGMNIPSYARDGVVSSTASPTRMAAFRLSVQLPPGRFPR